MTHGVAQASQKISHQKTLGEALQAQNPLFRQMVARMQNARYSHKMAGILNQPNPRKKLLSKPQNGIRNLA